MCSRLSRGVVGVRITGQHGYSVDFDDAWGNTRIPKQQGQDRPETKQMTMTASSILPGIADGPVLFSDEPLSFWGGVDPATGRIIDVHHPLQGRVIAGRVLMMPSTRGSCTGSGASRISASAP